jgi:hypothetical protein
MELNDAAQMLGVSQPVRGLMADIREEVLDNHVEHTNEHGLAKQALTEIEHGIASLARLGHSVHLAWTKPEQAVPLEYPKMLIHASEPQHRIVQSSQDEAAARADGWHSQGESPQDPPVEVPADLAPNPAA